MGCFGDILRLMIASKTEGKAGDGRKLARESARHLAPVPADAISVQGRRVDHMHVLDATTTEDTNVATKPITLDALLESYIADAIADMGTGSKAKGTADADALSALSAFAQSDDAVLTFTLDNTARWTFSRKSVDPTEAKNMREVYNVVKRAADSMTDAPIYVVTYTTDDDAVTVLNTGVAVREALEAHKRVIAKAVAALQRANTAAKALGPRASAGLQRDAKDRIARADAKVKNAKADAARLIQAGIDNGTIVLDADADGDDA